MQSSGQSEPLRDACRAWQSGRDQGSSRLRGAARVLTGHPHYFEADFIKAHEGAAREDPVTLDRARVLLHAIAESPPRTAAEWLEGADQPFAGRGLTSKSEDGEILKTLSAGQIVMPLWGISLDRKVAEGFGTRFLLQITGPFRGVAAWRASGEKPEEQEIITGGRYEVIKLDPRDGAGPTVAWLREIEPVLPASPA
jgi:hypothetical protein